MAYRCNIFYAVLFMVLYLCIPSCASTQLVTPNTLNNIVVDKTTGNLYIGGINFLLKTNSDLIVIKNNTTGPLLDSEKCDPAPEVCNFKRVLTDNYNKVLLIHESKKQLVVCGNVYFGVCELRDMDTLERVSKTITGMIASRYIDIPAAGIISNGPFDKKVFYIATSWTKSAYKDMSYDVSAISTRNLDPNKKFELVADGGKVSKLKFKDESYEVSYVYGFSSGQFNYFITVQESYDSYKKKTSDPNDNVYETKISHFCHKDETYITYVEMPLKCLSKNGTDFNIVTSAFVAKPGTKLAAKLGITTNSDVVFVTFSKSNIGSRKPLAESALCYYSITEIEAVIKKNAEKCFRGKIALGMPWINDDRRTCAIETYRGSCPLPFSSTGNHPIGGSISLSKQAIMEHNNLVSITALAYEEYTAVLLGDSAGNLLKVSIGDDVFPAQPYHKKAIAPGEPIKKLVLSNDQLSVYAATRNKVLKLPIEDCSSHSTCQSCTGHGDPFCGWCSLYRKCSRRALCANAGVHPLRFTTNVSQCIEFASIQPPRFSHGSVTKLEATIQSLPPAASGQNYKCYFNKIERATTVFANGTVRCITPPASDLPRITSPTGDITIDLSLYSSESGRLFVSTKIAFYNCSLMKGCIVCSESDYDCDWCTYQGKCYANGNSYCPKSGEIVLSKKKRPVDAVGCPYIEGNQSFLLPNKISKPIVLKAKNLPVNKYNYGYKCLLMVEDDNRPFEVDATRDSDTSLTCQPYKYSYMASQQYYSAKLKVLWRRTEEIQKPDTVTVSLYKCNVNRNDCSTCLVADSRLECGWCKADINSCKVKEACNQVWVHPSQFCNTMPVIKKFWPITGPPQGGTEVEIDGVDFGKQFSDIERSVTIANYTCIPDPHKYIVSKKIICNTTHSGGDVEGPIKVDVNNFIGVSTLLFSYQTPEIEDFHPKKGPESGGSSVNITGVKLNTGRKIMVWLGDAPCLVDRAKVTNISIPCVTQPTSLRSRRAASNDSSSSGDVVVSFDGYKPPSPSVKFEFTADPVFYNIKPDRTFPSGGLRLTVTGKYLDSVQVPKIFFVKAADRSVVSKPEICTIISSTTMYCPSPNVTSFGVAPGSSNGSEVIVGLIMDNVQGLNNVTTLAITADPYIEPFEKGTQINENLVLILTGNNLDILQKDEILVTIEGVACNLTSLDEKQLVCNAPKKSELPKIEDGDRLDYTVIVKAAFLTFYPGKVKYREMPIQSKFPMLYIYIGVGVGVFIFLLVIICLVCAYRKKKRQQSRNIQEFEMRMDNLEIKVAKECREAFAELQTDMTDWTSDLSSARMPFWGFRTYALHVLFPGVVDHPVLTMKSNLTPNWENGLRKFAQLIQNKDFLLIFVRTLEQQNSFNMKDRCNLASLLMVALQAKMEYATDILKQLLCDLIRKSVAQSHPKLLLRRTESVAEKLLTNWLAFCMYNHLKEESGKPLFMLFMAIKGQIEKGPVDMLTGEARYSLSEDKLLRHAIEYEVLKVSVSQDDEPPINVSLLNIDTITQAKHKILDAIHKHEPFSSRPKQNNFQLSWMSKDGVEKVLMDDDASSVIEGPWRRLNTLEHYKVPNDAFLKLSTHHTHFYGSTSSDLQLHSIPRTTFKPFSYTPLSRGSKEDLLEEGGRVWHLVKQQDYSAEQQEDKMLSEIYLTRLLATKGTLQKFVSGLFDAIFSVNRPNLKTPIAVKLMFDLLDKHAQELNLSDPEVLHTWKNNSLPLRFWINIVKNPNFIFDVHKGGTVDSCLSVIAQLFMDACSTSEHRLGVDSPSNKLLYAKEIPSYKKHVESYYSDIRSQATPSENELSDFFADLSMQYGKMFNSDIALKELFRYVVKYQDQLQEKLEECGLPKLASNLEYIVAEIADD